MDLGIDIGGTNIKVVVLSNVQRIEEKFQIDNRSTGNYFDLLDKIEGIIRTSRSKYDIEKIGIGAAGQVDYSAGQIVFSPNIPFLSNKNVASDLFERTKIHIIIDNDVNCFAMGEFKFGAGRGSLNMVGLTVGTGIGGGLIINGDIYRGSNFLAGEVGHISLYAKGDKDKCGAYGCAELFVSRKSLINRVLKNFSGTGKIYELVNGIAEDVTPKTISGAAALGDDFANSIIDTAAFYLGTLINDINNILDPDVFVLGGGIAQVGTFFLQRVQAYFDERSFGGQNRKRVLASELGIYSGALGAAILGSD